jgi:hypothetical protein
MFLRGAVPVNAGSNRLLFASEHPAFPHGDGPVLPHGGETGSLSYTTALCEAACGFESAGSVSDAEPDTTIVGLEVAKGSSVNAAGNDSFSDLSA